MKNTPPAPIRRARAALFITTLATLLTACGSRPTRPEAPPVEIEMDPIVVEYDLDAEDDADKIRAYDAQSLFEDGFHAFERHDFAVCDTSYGELIERFPQSELVYLALYNRGLCLEQLGEHRRAGTHFRRYAQLAVDLKAQRDGEFRWGYNLVKTGDYPTALALYDRLLAAEDPGPLDRAECHLRRGIAHARLKHPGEAEADFKKAMRFIDEGTEGFTQGSELLAETHFRRAELYQALAHDVALKLPVSKMREDLDDKVRFFRQSQDSYIKALNVQHSYWATAAGLKLGELYEEFYLDVLGAEIPADFDLVTRRFYLVELRKQLQPLLEQSLTIYEKNITMSERMGAENEWVAATETRLARLRGLIEASRTGGPVELTPLEPVEPPPPLPPPAPPAGDTSGSDAPAPDPPSPGQG